MDDPVSCSDVPSNDSVGGQRGRERPPHQAHHERIREVTREKNAKKVLRVRQLRSGLSIFRC